MALSAFMLGRVVEGPNAIDESLAYAHSFSSNDDIGCVFEMNAGILQETINYMTLRQNIDDQLLECAMKDRVHLYRVIDEGALDAIKEQVKKFFDKIISFVRSIVEKLKASFYKMTGQYGKWVKTMRPYIKKATELKDSGKFKFTMYDYNESFILRDMVKGIGELHEDWKKDLNTTVSMLEDPEKELKSLYTNANGEYSVEISQYAGKDKDSESVKDVITRVKERAKQQNTKTEDTLKAFPSVLAKKFEVGGSSLDSAWGNITKKVHGGSETKKECVVGNNTSHLLDVIEKSKDSISELKDKYETHLKVLTDFREKIESAGTSIDAKAKEGSAEIPAGVIAAYNELYRSKYDHLMKITSTYETATNTARERNVSYIQEMTKAYMAALSAFSKYKPDKDSETDSNKT